MRVLITRLLPGMVLYHGTPYGKTFSHPRGPAWFTPDKDVTENYLDRPWSPRAEAWAEGIEKNPRRLKFRLKREVKLPWAGPPFGAEKHDVLAMYAAKVLPFTEGDLSEAIERLGTGSGRIWIEDDSEEVSEAERHLQRFADVVDFMRFLCENTDFEGWIERYRDGGTEVALCNPKRLLRPAARQLPRGPKMNRRQRIEAIRDQLRQQRFLENYRAKMEAERLRQEAERDKEEDLRYKVYRSVTGQDDPGEIDYSDPEFRRALDNWTDYVSPFMVGYNADSWDDVRAADFMPAAMRLANPNRVARRWVRSASRHRMVLSLDSHEVKAPRGWVHIEEVGIKRRDY